MKLSKAHSSWRKILPIAILLIGIGFQSIAQEISVWQFRRVEQANMQEFIEKETKYWSKVAEAAVEKGNLAFWGLFVKQGGFNLPEGAQCSFYQHLQGY